MFAGPGRDDLLAMSNRKRRYCKSEQCVECKAPQIWYRSAGNARRLLERQVQVRLIHARSRPKEKLEPALNGLELGMRLS